ncbi:hypothetical protein F5Y04DRAFT_253495 [Hypomontagnella monticulosa]|nr:hypothetical protein F5Y04DRAFT_253495 [Hypomontagnella monticulosa]
MTYEATNTKPGKSTHPYDTGVGHTTTTGAEEGRVPTATSHRTEPNITPKVHEPQTLDQLRKTKKKEPSPIIEQNKPHASTQKENESNWTLDSRIGDSSRSRHKFKFRSMLGLNKNQRKVPNTSSSELASVLTPARRLSVEDHSAHTRIRWRSFRRQRSMRDNARTNRTLESEEESSMLHNEGEDFLSALKPRDFSKRYRASQYSRAISPKNEDGMKIRGTDGNPESSTETKQHAHKGPEKTGKSLQPSGGSSSASGPTFPRRHRRSPSSSRARPSTTGTTSTPRSAGLYTDATHEGSRHETPSPLIPTQVLRLLLGPGRTPPSKAITQLDLRRHEPEMSASTLHLAPPSRDSHPSGRPSADHKNRPWVPFWGTPKQQPEQSNVGEALTQDDDREPSPREQARSRGRSQKKRIDLRSRKKWRSG